VTALGKEGRGERYDLGQEKTASGELFDPAQLTGAAADMPLSSLALVTNLENNKEVIVRVNDRPSRRDRVVQLSPRAAEYVGLDQRDARVRIRYLGPAPRLTAKTQPNPVYAEAIPASVSQEPMQAPPPAATTPSLDDQARGGTYGVQIGAFGERANAERARERAEEAGPVSISQAQIGASTIYRVRLGPWPDRTNAENARKKAVTLGFSDARVTDR
jgi:rare lipoprotein A